MSTTAEPLTPATVAPLAAEHSHYEGLYGGLDKIDAQLSSAARDQLATLTQSEEDPQEARARMVNMAYIKAKNPQIDEDALANNWEIAKSAYAKQVLGVDKPAVTDKELYAGISGRFQKQRDESKLLGEGMGLMFDAFRQGGDNQRQAFTSALAQMKGKPGYDPTRLDVYTHLAQQTWQHWQDSGQHYPAAVDAVGKYFQAYTSNTQDGDAQMTARDAALRGLASVPADQQDAILGLAMRQKGATEDAGFAEKAAGRVEEGVGKLGESAGNALRDLLTGQSVTGGAMGVLADQASRKTARKLDSALDGSLDPYHGSNWFSEGVLAAGEGLPRMLAMFHPAGIVANVAAFSEEARGHFEDAGVPADKAMALGVAASIPLTALQMVSSKTLAGKTATNAMEAWMLRNVSGRTGAALAAGYAKNMLALGAENTALLSTVTAGQQLTEPAIQSLGHMLDGTIPGVKWTGPDGELTRLAAATPQTLASLVPLIAIGAGAGVLRARGAALELRTIQDRPALEALGLKPEAVRDVLAAKTVEDAVALLQHGFRDRTIPKQVENGVTIYRAGSKLESGVKAMTSWSEDRATAEAYLDNPGFGGKVLRQEIYPIKSFLAVDTTSRRGMQDFAEAMGFTREDGLEWFDSGWRYPWEESQKVASALRASEYDAIKYKDDFPEGATTTLPLRDFKSDESISTEGKVSLSPDGGYSVKDAAGNPVGQAASPEMAAKLAQSLDLKSPDLTDSEAPSMPFGITNPAMARAMNWIKGVATGAKNIWQEARALPQFGKFKQVINDFNAELQRRSMNLAGEVKDVFAAVPDRLTRSAMYRAIEAGFDRKQLQDWRDNSTRDSSKRAYDAALKLTPEQITYAKKVQAWFEAKHPQAVAAGILDPQQKRANYVPLVVDKPFAGGRPSDYTGKFKRDFSHAIERDFENSFDLENATDDKGQNLGLKLKTDDIAEVIAAYGAELDKVDLTRQALKALESSKAKASDGEPLVAPVHGVLSKGDAGMGDTISNPHSTQSESGVRYETLDHPAFKKFYFAGNNEDGLPVMYMGEMGLHPEIYQHMANILGRSRLQNWIESEGGALAHLAKVAVKATQESQKFIKANMFSASIFHATHIGTRAAGNLVAPWELKRVDMNHPKTMDAMRHGLQLGGDNASMQAVAEGLGGGKGYNVAAKIPGVGKVVTAITDLTFHEIIPAYKLETYNQLLKKNLDIYAKDIAAGRAKPEQVKYLTAGQVNARFGEQNYNDLGANPTFKHILSLTTLAPDFWRSTMQNLGQVAVGATGAKIGREPLKAFAITAGVTWLMARVLNKALSDDDSYHFDDPFNVHHGGRIYSFRTEVQDVGMMAARPATYLMGRLSPFAGSILEQLAGVNWRGEKVDTADVLKELAGKSIPAAAKFLPGVGAADEWATGRRATTSHFEQFLTSQGVRVARDSALGDAYKLAHEYKVEHGDPDKGGSFPVSKFQQLRYALEDKDDAKAAQEIATLREKGEPIYKVTQAFRASVFHAWTGSREKDAEFKASLEPEDKAKVEKAETHRESLYARYLSILDKQPSQP